MTVDPRVMCVALAACIGISIVSLAVFGGEQAVAGFGWDSEAPPSWFRRRLTSSGSDRVSDWAQFDLHTAEADRVSSADSAGSGRFGPLDLGPAWGDGPAAISRSEALVAGSAWTAPSSSLKNARGRVTAGGEDSAGEGRETALVNVNGPWMDPTAVMAVRMFIKPGGSMLEYGCGHSTRYFARFTRYYAAIDGIQKWADMCKSDLKADGLEHAEVVFVPKDLPDTPARHASGQTRESYVKRFDTCCRDFKASEADTILVDGAARPQILKHIMDRVGYHTVIILHDTNRNSAREIDWVFANFDVVMQTHMTIQGLTTGGMIVMKRKWRSRDGSQRSAVWPVDPPSSEAAGL